MDARTLANEPMPPRIARLPRNHVGYPIPWFVAVLDDGTRDFRIADNERKRDAIRFRKCWMCGETLGRHAAFTVGPMCALNRISAEPPSHVACAVYAAKVCPFLATPSMRRRDSNMPTDQLVPVAGHMIERNPGVTLVWVTRTWKPFQPPVGPKGVLFRFSDPTALHWFAEGRDATRAEVLASIDSGLPALQAACQLDADPAGSLRILDDDHQRALELVPTA